MSDLKSKNKTKSPVGQKKRVSEYPMMNLAKNNEWLWNSRWTHWWLKSIGPGTENEDCMQPTFSGPIDDDAILRGVKALKRANINTVLTEGLRGIIRFEHDGKTDAVIEAIRKATQVCHRAGIRVIHHTTTAFAGRKLSEFPVACQEWLNIDARTGNHAYMNSFNSAGDCAMYLWCINNPDFRAEYFRLSKKVLQETGVDGFMTDEVYFRTGWHNCACSHCREKFRLKTGFILPPGDAAYFWGRLDNEAFRAWIRFRCASVGDFYADLYATLKEAHPHPVLLGCEGDPVGAYAPQAFGDGNEERMRGVNLLFTETGGAGTLLYSWRRLSAEYMMCEGLNNYYGTPTLSVQYNPNPREGFFSWALRVAHGVRVWATSGGGFLSRCDQLLNAPKDMALYGELFGWEEKHKNELAGAIQPLANIAVLLSHATRDMTDGSGGENYYVREVVGWCEALTDEYIPYVVIVDEDLTPSRLRQYESVILPNAVCMSDDACLAVGEYVAHGGILIFTHETGLYDETGRKKVNQNRLGAFQSAIKQGAAAGESSVQFGKHDLGKWVYFAHKPGRAVYTHSSNTAGNPRRRDAENFETIPAGFAVSNEDQILQKSLMVQAARWAIADQLPLAVKQAPAGLLIKAFRHQNSKRRAIVIHLLNCLGEDAVKFGEIIPEKYPVIFPSLENDIILELRLDSIKQAYLISPDWPGKKPVKVTPVSNGFRLTILAHTLKRYEVLYIST